MEQIPDPPAHSLQASTRDDDEEFREDIADELDDYLPEEDPE